MIMPWKPKTGGIKKWLENLNREFENLGHQIYVFSPYKLPKPYLALFLTLNHSPFFYKRLGIIWEFIIKTIMYYPAVIPLVLLNDCVISFYPPDSIIFQIFAKAFKKKNISVVHQARNITKAKICHYLWKKHYMLADDIVAISDDVKEDVEKIYGVNSEKIVVIYNGLKLEKFEKIEDVELEGEPAILYVGRLEPIKGPDILVKAFSIICRKYSKAFLHMVGDGTLRKKLETLVKSQNLDKKVKFYGYVIPPYSHMKNADILVIPSRYDAMPNVALEAMACNVPIVASNVGGLKNIIIDGKNGLKAKPEPIDIAEKIMLLWKDDMLRDKIRNFQREFIKRFTWRKTAEEYLEIMTQR